MTIDQEPMAGTLAALKSVAEAHYGNFLLDWTVGEIAAGRPPGDKRPPVASRQAFLKGAYDLVIRNLEAVHKDTVYRQPLERFRDAAIASVEE